MGFSRGPGEESRARDIYLGPKHPEEMPICLPQPPLSLDSHLDLSALSESTALGPAPSEIFSQGGTGESSTLILSVFTIFSCSVCEMLVLFLSA